MGDTTTPQDPRTDRALGAFIGLAVGDALGTTIEFSPRDSYTHVTDLVGGGPFGLAPGEWTDDTSMALCLADSLIATGGELDPRDLAARFVRWWKQGENSVTGRCFDIGNATASALAAFMRHGEPVGSDSPRSAGNGGIMRQAPAVLAARGDLARAVELSLGQSRVTHASLECLEAADLLARVLHAAIEGVGQEALAAGAGRAWEAPKVAAIAEGAWRAKPRGRIASSGYVIDTLEAALWAVGTSGSFEEAVLKAVNLGDDADSVGAVAGQVAGGLWGYGSIPARWRQRIAWHDDIVGRAHALWGTGSA